MEIFKLSKTFVQKGESSVSSYKGEVEGEFGVFQSVNSSLNDTSKNHFKEWMVKELKVVKSFS